MKSAEGASVQNEAWQVGESKDPFTHLQTVKE